jgi:hypothetical protein
MNIDEFDWLYKQYTNDKDFTSTLPTPSEQYRARPNEILPVIIYLHEYPTRTCSVIVSSTGTVSVPLFLQDHFR